MFAYDENLEANQLAILMQMAMIENRPEFVEIILEAGIDLKSFLNKRRLYFLYNSHGVINYKLI